MKQPLTAVQVQLFRLAYAMRERRVEDANAALHADLAALYAELGITKDTAYKVTAPTETEPAYLVGPESLQPELGIVP